MKLNTVPGQPGHLAEVLAVCFPATACTPPVENSKPSGASDGADGQGVCITKKSNISLDGRLVKKGQVVSYHGLCIRVQRVRLGVCYGYTLLSGRSDHFSCRTVRVVSL